MKRDNPFRLNFTTLSNSHELVQCKLNCHISYFPRWRLRSIELNFVCLLEDCFSVFRICRRCRYHEYWQLPMCQWPLMLIYYVPGVCNYDGSNTSHVYFFVFNALRIYCVIIASTGRYTVLYSWFNVIKIFATRPVPSYTWILTSSVKKSKIWPKILILNV